LPNTIGSENFFFKTQQVTFQEFAKLSMGGESEDFFKSIASGLSKEDDATFDVNCQQLTYDLWRCIFLSVTARNKKNADASYHYQVLSYMQESDGSNFTKLRLAMPQTLRNRHGMSVLCQTLSRFLNKEWLKEALTEIRVDLCPAQATEENELFDFSKEVNRFVGWAVRSMINKKKKQFRHWKKRDPKEFDEEMIMQEIGLLKTMGVFEHQILDDLDYIAKYYCPFDRLYNDGFLAMVHPLYADCGLRLLSVIAISVTDDEILKHGNMTAKRAEAAVKNDKDLIATFLILCQDTQELSEPRKTKLFYAIADKVINSRLGTAIFKRYKSMTTG
jgi:hypothetical protein